MKKLFAVAFVLFVGVAFVTVGFAAEKTVQFTGEVVKVDTAAKTITAKAKKGEETFDVAQAQFKGYKDLSEVKEGDKVRVAYFEKDGKKIARNVSKVGAAKPAEPAKPAAPPAAKPAEPAKPAAPPAPPKPGAPGK